MLIKQSPPISTPNTSIFLDSLHDDQEISYKLNIEDIKKVDNSSNKIQISKNNKVIHNAELKIKEIKNVNKIDSNNYVYLGSTNMSLLNNMGLTLEDDGSLLLIKGKTHDLFTGLYQKYIRGGFKYQGFNIKNKEGSELKFKELYVDADGFLIGKKKDDNNDVNDLYKIKFSKIEESYSLNDNQESNKNFIVEYEPYIPRKNEIQELSSINNVIEQHGNNKINIRRKDFEVGIKLENNKLSITGLTGILIAEKTDEVDCSLWHDIKLPLKKQDIILAIKPVLNRVQIVIKRDGKIKIYYLNPFHIFAVKPYEYQVSRLTKTPPMSFYSMVGENNYNNYHSGQPYSSQTVGNFSSRHIPFFSSFIDNARIHFDKAKESYALKKYSKLASNMAKSVDPGFRGLFSGIRALTNSTTTPAKTKDMALNNAKLNIDEHFKVLGRICKNIENGRTHGEIIQTLIQEMKKKESIMLSQYNDIRAFFGISAFNLTDKLGVNAFAQASYAKTHTLIINKNKDDEITFSFINEKNINTSLGLSAGVGTYEKRSNYNSIEYGVVTPVMASVVLNVNYAKSSDFSFNIPLNKITEFIDKELNITEYDLINKTKLETNTNKEISLGIESRAEISGDIDVMLNKKTGVTVPRNALGVDIKFNILKIDTNINKIINAGEMDVINEKKEINLGLLEFIFEAYRDLKFTPSSTTANSQIQWYPLTTVRDFETMLKRKVNYLFNRTIFSSENIKNKEQEDKIKKKR